MVNIKAQKKELAEKICRQRKLKPDSAAYKDTVKSLSRMSVNALMNLVRGG